MIILLFLNLLCRFAFFYRLANEKQADNINNVNKLGNDLQDCGSGADFCPACARAG